MNDSFVANLDLFSITDKLELLLTQGAADALNKVYGTALPGGLSIGLATVDVAVVPLPAALPLMLAALAGLGIWLAECGYTPGVERLLAGTPDRRERRCPGVVCRPERCGQVSTGR